MGGHDRLRPRGVAGAQGGDDLEVVAEAAAQRRLVVGVEVAPHDRRVDRRGQRGGERRVVGEGDQPVVEGPVQRDERVEVLPRAGAADLEHAVREVVEVGDVGRRGARDGEAGQLRFQGGAQVEDALELGDGPGGDAGTPVGHDLDQALGGQPGERLADRGAADAQPLGELDLAQPGPGGELRARISSRSSSSARSADVRTVSPVTLPGRLCAT